MLCVVVLLFVFESYSISSVNKPEKIQTKHLKVSVL